MKKMLTLAAALTMGTVAHGQYQAANADFEKWEEVSSPEGVKGEEPLAWNAYLTATGSHRNLANQQGALLERSQDTRPGSKGQYSALIKARTLLVKNLYGNLTSGCANVTGMNPKDGSSYYNYTNPDVTGQAMPFTGRPDSVKVWLKLKATAGNNGLVSAVLHTQGTYKTPIVAGEAFQPTAKVVAQAVQMVTAEGTWKAYTLPLGYTAGVTENPAYALISFQTSNLPGEGDKAATMNIDDLEFIYNSQLASIHYAGKSILGQTSVEAVYDAQQLSALRSTGISAQVETAYNEATHQLTVTVKGGDYAVNPTNIHTYTFQFKAPAPTPEPEPQPDPTPSHTWPAAGTEVGYTDDLQVTVNAVTNPAQPYRVALRYKQDGRVSLGLKDFVLLSAGDQIPIGNIVLDDVQLTWDKEKGCATFSKTEDIYITEGELSGVDFWMGPMLNSMYGAIPVTLSGTLADDKLYMNLYINMMNTSLRQMIYVTFGNPLTPTPQPDPEPEPEPQPEPQPTYTPLPTAGEKVYHDDLYVQVNTSLNGPLPADVQVTYREGYIDFALNDFSMVSDGNIMYVGNILIPNLQVTHVGNGLYTYSFHDKMEIGAGSFSQDEYGDPIDWLGPMLGPLDLGLDGKITADKAYVTIDIPLASMGQNIHVIFGKDDFETAIRSLKYSAGTPRGIYDLNGRAVTKVIKGRVYIENGKKVRK